MTPHAELTEAYYTLFDVKDAAIASGNEALRYKAYEALNEVAAVMTMLELSTPVRFDSVGRPAN